jgi:hypothetical protein
MKRGDYRVPSLKTGSYGVYSMKKTGGRMKMFITRANEAQPLLSLFSGPFFGVSFLCDYELCTRGKGLAENSSYHTVVFYGLNYFVWVRYYVNVGSPACGLCNCACSGPNSRARLFINVHNFSLHVYLHG